MIININRYDIQLSKKEFKLIRYGLITAKRDLEKSTFSPSYAPEIGIINKLIKEINEATNENPFNIK